MTIHFVALPHTRFDDVASSSCAYTVKGVRWSRMMQDLGWDFIVYGSGDHTPVDVNFVSCLSDQDREDIFGTDKAVPDLEWDPFTQAYWTLFHTRAHREIVKRWRDGDVIAVSASGWGGVDAFSDLGPVWSRLSRRAFAIYFIHPPVMVALALAWSQVHAPHLLKFALTGSAACVTCYLLAGLLLRFAWLSRVF